MKNAVGGEIVGIGISRPLAGDDADAAPGRDPLTRRLDHRLVHGERRRGEILKVEIGVISPGRKSGGEIALKIAFGQAIMFEKKAGLIDIFFHVV